MNQTTKPIILLNIDSLMPEPLEIATQTGRAPALQFLKENGNYIPNMVSSFPTMSVTIDSTLLTGAYADKHHIPGLNWFDYRKKEIVNYGTGFRETTRQGVRRTTHNMLYRLNNEHMSTEVSTIYEDLAKRGIVSASINSFVYRGNTPQKLHVPRLFSALTYFENGEWTTQGPSILSLGHFSKLRKWGFTPQIAAGNYKFTARELRFLIRKNNLPAFTFCIFQDMDARIHFRGRMDLKGISKIDKEIQKILNMYSSWEEAVEQNVWMVIGDNGHSPTGTRYKEFIIDLRKILKNYRIARIERQVKNKDQLVLCVNQRMTYIYVLDKNLSLKTIVDDLKTDTRIDIIAWKEEDAVHVTSGLREGSLRFRPNGQYMDVYNQTWELDGEGKLLNLDVTDDNKVSFGDYPDALARLHSALHSHEGRFIIVNAKPGCDFKAQLTPFHLSGAAHGSLHKQESFVPLIITGSDEKPTYPRFVDMKEFILRLVVD
ncbi:alkaline phosphatase family protein [Salirhabdus sp. Marseille-P4669]|uniref:alkaline phosphatase family protein n=1 Tax=Salirhabdus sp. Marseille-P4669 TaxID=2042310 RepID=UPI000C7B40E7|nr:alkaline phosphatase family protein [Salirhabdus sp. Marseille-P4669]